MLIRQLLLYAPTDMKTNWIRPSITFPYVSHQFIFHLQTQLAIHVEQTLNAGPALMKSKNLHTQQCSQLYLKTCKRKFPLLQTTIAYLYL